MSGDETSAGRDQYPQRMDQDQLHADPYTERLFLQRLRSRIRLLVSATVRGTRLQYGDAIEDLTQETLLKLWQDDYRSLRNWRGQTSFDSYLCVIVRNVVRDALRRRTLATLSLTPESPDGAGIDPIDPPDPCPGPEETVLANWEHAQFRQIVQELPVPYRDVTERYYYHEQPCKEIAEDLGITSNHVGVLLNRARRKIRRRVLN